MDPHVVDSGLSVPPSAGPAPSFRAVEERVARRIVAAHRSRLDWLLRVPPWAELYQLGMVELKLPGRRQGIPFDAAMMSLPLEGKFELVRWVMDHFRDHLRSEIGQRICRLLGVEAFNRLTLEDLLTWSQWVRLRDEGLFRLAREHRRYKRAQRLLFTECNPWVERIVAESVFDPAHRADCIQEGALGLLAAIDRVSESDCNFAAYATPWIRRRIRNYLMRQRLPVCAPVNLISRASALRREEGERAPDDSRAATRLEALALEALRSPVISIDAPREEGAMAAADWLVDPGADSPADEAGRADVCRAVGRALQVLTAKQRDVIVRRYGLDGTVTATLPEIARGSGISHQQVSMRERRGFRRLHKALSIMARELYGVA